MTVIRGQLFVFQEPWGSPTQGHEFRSIPNEEEGDISVDGDEMMKILFD